MSKVEKGVSERYPIIVLIKILSTFDYKEGFVRDWNNQKLTINKIEDIIGLRPREMNAVIRKLETMGLANEYKNKNKRHLIIEDIVIKAIKDSKNTKEILLKENDKKTMKQLPFTKSILRTLKR
mgnify:CR=1 FL=1